MGLFPEDYATHGYYAAEQARKVFRSLSFKKMLPRLLISSLEPEDDAARAAENLCRIAEHHPEAVAAYPDLAVAIAVVFDGPFPASWPHPFTRQKLIVKKEVPPERRFEFFTASEKGDKLLLRLDELTVKELTFLVDSILSLEEIAWAQGLQLKNPDHLAGVWGVLPYDQSRAGSADYLWPHSRYTLPEIAKKGGICMDQAYYIAQSGKAKGVPTILFLGQGRSGGHAWVGYLKESGEWELDVARARSEKYPVGTMFEPQTWRRLTDAQFRFLTADLTKTHSYNRYQLALQWAAMNREESFYREILQYARGHMPRHFASWELEAEWLQGHEVQPAEREAFWKRWITNFRDEPDMRMRGQIRLLKHYRAQEATRAAERLTEEMIGENQAGRFDLAIVIAAETVFDVMGRGDWDAAKSEFEDAMARFRKNAGGHLFYNLVEPYVERCIEAGQGAMAVGALASLGKVLQPQPNSLLAADIEKLRAVVAGISY